ncbi:MAG: biotin carboxylase [Spirochaetales bacterium]|nr:biotin carboxylase [Leptospiraceae bacterium]MCP5479978.1 biotin carboxylase [Spirochaetales bacterium]MCP5486608.1 biotin carboxylase [Spirochaetales bacterium]
MAQDKQDKYQKSSSEWVRSFSCSDLNVLIVCRGPIRKEAMDIFAQLGATYGLLLSEKDSVTYPHTLAPELRLVRDPERVHRIPDYIGATTEERRATIKRIIDIARDYGYTHVFAGYGFMAEDAGFVRAIEEAGIGFIGPASPVHQRAGAKDTAKKIAREVGVSVTPGVDNISALTLISKVGKSKEALLKHASAHGIEIEQPDDDIEALAEQILQKGYRAGVGLLSVQELQEEAFVRVEQLLKENPGRRFRLKYIGGGGGKGQRIVTKADQVRNAVMEVLSESKALGDADNKNFLMELNIEHTRHNEIQLLGNGEWCVALGGRDCSLQMHEQKLVELSITDELFVTEIEKASREGNAGFAAQLRKDRETLQAMESQAERFGAAVALNSVSTFECIVSGNDFFFMEMNTRIQVEHRVTEMVYTLRFTNPDNDQDSFDVDCLVEAMALMAAHGPRLPKPERVVRNHAAGEVRLNAMNDALQPHAGGLIEFWSAPIASELRDDQGIGVRNPDTGSFVHYHLAGAYDSNIALIVTSGTDRRDNLEQLGDILRRMEIRGHELKTNREFHYGIINFMLGLDPMLKPDTRFVIPYLTAVGTLAEQLESFDLFAAWSEIQKRIAALYGNDGLETLMTKQTLLSRPLDLLLRDPHGAAGWLVRNHRRAFVVENGQRVVWKRNPFRALADLYHYLHLEERKNASPVHKIWADDHALLMRGLDFYDDLERRLGVDTESEFQDSRTLSFPAETTRYRDLDRALLGEKNPFVEGSPYKAMDDPMFQACAAAHRGWQSGMTLLDLIILMGARSGLLEFSVNPDLTPQVPERFLETEAQARALKALAPPPPASANELLSVSGGMFYTRETPQSAPFLEVGQHFNVGDPIYIIEVMKMFNKVYAEFSGTVTEILVDGDTGKVVKKGQPLFRVKPDEEIQIETPADIEKRRREATLELMGLAVV